MSGKDADRPKPDQKPEPAPKPQSADVTPNTNDQKPVRPAASSRNHTHIRLWHCSNNGLVRPGQPHQGEEVKHVSERMAVCVPEVVPVVEVFEYLAGVHLLKAVGQHFDVVFGERIERSQNGNWAGPSFILAHMSPVKS